MASYKYSGWSFGQVEALINIIGEENAKSLLAGKAKVVIEEIVDSILDFLTTITIVATTAKFVAEQELVVGQSGIAWLGKNFKTWFGNKVEEPQPETVLRSHRLRKQSRDLRIIAELGGEEKVETTLSAIVQLISRQAKGESGALLNNGYVNIFYVRDAEGVLLLVGVDWLKAGWGVNARAVEGPREWRDGSRVFSR